MNYTRQEIEQISDYLVDGFWDYAQNTKYMVKDTGVITYSYKQSTSPQRVDQIERALDVWSKILGFEFQLVANYEAGQSNSHVTFDVDQNFHGVNFSVADPKGDLDYYPGRWLVDYSTITAGDSLMTNYTDEQYMRFLIHEIGHLLGLGHAGPYVQENNLPTPSATDTFQTSTMSYYYPSANSNVTGSDFYEAGPMMADIMAINDLYSLSHSVNGSSTNYEYNDYLNGTHTDANGNTSIVHRGFTIFDTGGIDSIIRTGSTSDEVLNLNQGYASSINGTINNLFIAFDTIIENVVGGSGNDTITGNDSKNKLEGNDGKDLIYGGGDDDEIYGGADGADELYGGSGNDFIDGWADLSKGTHSITIYGGTGNDDIRGGRGQDGLYGGADNDTITGSVAKDTIYGDDVNNTLTGNDNLSGQGGGDFIYGGKGTDTIEGGSGEDRLYGGEQSDRLLGESDDDKLYGDDGNDYLYGGIGNDQIKGGNDNDYIMGDEGNDILFGGSGADVFVFDPYDNQDTVKDFSIAEGDTVDWNTLIDLTQTTIEVSGQDVTVNYGISDSILFENVLASSTLQNFLDHINIPYAPQLPSGINVIHGTSASENLTGTSGVDAIYGNGGTDFLGGGDGDDFIFMGYGGGALGGGSGNDKLYGGNGQDGFYVIANDNNPFMEMEGLGDDTIFNFGAEDTLYMMDIAYLNSVSHVNGNTVIDYSGYSGSGSVTVIDAFVDEVYGNTSGSLMFEII